MTLSFDGLTITAVQASKLLASSTRSALGAIDFATPVTSPFTNINAAIAAGGGSPSWPVISADQLAFYYRIDGATSSAMNGIYESVRSATASPFPVAQLMPATVQQYAAISGVSSDRMTAFMATSSYGTAILVRDSVTQPFGVPVTSAPPASAWRVVPIVGCSKLLGTCEPGGCANESICVWTQN